MAIRKIPGVEAVEVSLNQGLAAIRFAPENRVTVQQVRGAIRRNGFTPKQADVRIAGRLTEREGVWMLEVPGTGERYRLHDTPGQRRVAALRPRERDAEATITGVVPASASPPAGEPLTLVVDSVTIGSGH